MRREKIVYACHQCAKPLKVSEAIFCDECVERSNSESTPIREAGKDDGGMTSMSGWHKVKAGEGANAACYLGIERAAYGPMPEWVVDQIIMDHALVSANPQRLSAETKARGGEVVQG